MSVQVLIYNSAPSVLPAEQSCGGGIRRCHNNLIRSISTELLPSEKLNIALSRGGEIFLSQECVWGLGRGFDELVAQRRDGVVICRGAKTHSCNCATETKRGC